MNKHQIYEQKTENLVRPIAEENQFELVDVEFVKEAGSWYLRVYLDKEGGITIDDLAMVNRKLGELLDRDDFVEESYILELSSPGLTRPFKKPKDYIRNLGKDVEVKVFQPLTYEEGGKTLKAKEFVGVLKEFNEDKITLEFEGEETMEIEVKNIALIRQSIDF